MIPKIIHYCWFGRGEKTVKIKKCMDSWKKYCPDYEIVEWNEDNFDIHQNLFAMQAYENKKWAFVSDYVRLAVLYKYGGIYMDTDVEIIKPIDSFLQHAAFSGFENPQTVLSAIIGAEKEHPMIGEWLHWYDDRMFIENGKMWHEPNTIFLTASMKKKGLALNNKYQEIEGYALYPQTYFCPISVDGMNDCKTKDTFAVHHFTSTWRGAEEIKKFKRVKWHQSTLYKIMIFIRFLPNRALRKMIGDSRVEWIKEKVKK